jgi:hypothetical protein
MPAKSQQQQKFMGMVHALNKGDIKPSDVSKSVRDVAKTIKKSDAKDFASTKHNKIPRKVKEQLLTAFKEYAAKMGRDNLGGDDYTSKRKGGLRDFDGYDNVDYNKDMPQDESVNEATRGQIHKAAKKGSFPITIVVVKNGKVIHQELVKTPEAVPASFKVIEKKYKGATISIEDKTGKRLYEGMFSTLDQIRKDSKDVRDFVKNVFKDRDFIKMKNDKEFIKYLKSIYEGVDESKGVPQNYMQGRTSDYHTALRGKNRDYSGGTNFKKNNHGHPDIEKDDEDQETNSLSVKQTKIKSETFKVAGRPVKVNKGKSKNGTDWTVTFKNGKTVPLSDVLSLIKPTPKITKEEMGNLSSSERLELYKLYSKAMKAMPGSPNQKKIKVLINKLRKKADLKPLPISEYGQRLDLSYIEDMEAKLKGTPEPKDAIDRHIDEYIGGSYEFTRGDNYGQNSVNEIGIFPISNYVRDMIPRNMINTVNRQNKEKFNAVIDDLIRTLNHFWKKNNIPYRVRKR